MDAVANIMVSEDYYQDQTRSYALDAEWVSQEPVSGETSEGAVER